MTFVKHNQHAPKAHAGATLAHSGVLSFGKLMRDEFSLAAGGYAELLFCDESRRLALKPHPADQAPPEGAAKLMSQGAGCCVAMRGLMRTKNIAPGRYAARWDESLGLIVLERAEQPS